MVATFNVDIFYFDKPTYAKVRTHTKGVGVALDYSESYALFRPIDLEAKNIMTYSLCEEIQVARSLKKIWDTNF